MLESFLQISVRIIYVLVAANLIGMQATRPMLTKRLDSGTQLQGAALVRTKIKVDKVENIYKRERD